MKLRVCPNGYSNFRKEEERMQTSPLHTRHRPVGLELGLSGVLFI